MSDEPFRFAISPVVTERNARALVDMMAQCFPESGAICEDLRRKFEEITGLKRQSFYDTLAYCKYKQWVIGGAKDRREKYRFYTLNLDGCWREPVSTGEPVGEPRSRDQLEYLSDSRAQRVKELEDKVERLLDWSDGGDVGVALPSLIKIVGDDTASVRQRLRASACVLAYKTDNEATTFVKRFLESICANSNGSNIDHKVEAAQLLRRHESPRIAPETVRPSYRENEPAEPVVPLLELVRQRRERADRMQAEMIRQYGWRDNSSGGNRSDGTPDS